MKRTRSILLSILLLTTIVGCEHDFGLGSIVSRYQSAVAVTTVLLNCGYATDANRTQAERDHARQVCETGLLYFAVDAAKDREHE